MTVEAIALKASPIITFGYIMQVFFSLAIVLLFIYVTTKFLLPKFKFTNSGKYINIIDRVYLEPNVSLYVVQVGAKKWLLGVGQKSISRIEKLDE